MTEVNITTISRNFSDYINRVAYKGEQFTILRGNKPVAQITPVPAGKTLGDLLQIFSSSTILSAAEAAEFEKDLIEIRNQGNESLLEDPWASS